MTGAVSRRGLIRAAGAGVTWAAVGGWRPGWASASAPGPAWVVFDSSSELSVAFARRQLRSGQPRLVDVRSPDRDIWHLASGMSPPAAGATILGMTRWSDRVAIAGLLAERGFRLTRERRFNGHDFFSWSMHLEPRPGRTTKGRWAA